MADPTELDAVAEHVERRVEPEQPVTLPVDAHEAPDDPARVEPGGEAAADGDVADPPALPWRDHPRRDGPVDVEQVNERRDEPEARALRVTFGEVMPRVCWRRVRGEHEERDGDDAFHGRLSVRAPSPASKSRRPRAGREPAPGALRASHHDGRSAAGPYTRDLGES
jgi:hypothetical protein